MPIERPERDANPDTHQADIQRNTCPIHQPTEGIPAQLIGPQPEALAIFLVNRARCRIFIRHVHFVGVKWDETGPKIASASSTNKIRRRR